MSSQSNKKVQIIGMVIAKKLSEDNQLLNIAVTKELSKDNKENSKSKKHYPRPRVNKTDIY
nr:MAG TPA: hypothetical protein [Caudoviricetes sp.]